MDDTNITNVSNVSSSTQVGDVVNIDNCRYIPSLKNAYSTFNKRFIGQYGYKDDDDVDQNLLIIGHRGASYYIPEHTLGSHQLALELHVDYIDVDLAVTSDGYFITYHTVDLLDGSTTITEDDIKRLFPTKQKRKSPYTDITSYFTFDFTLQEIQQLFINQRFARTSYRTTLYDNVFHLPTLDDIIQLLYDWNRKALPSLLYRSHENDNRNISLNNATTYSFTTNTENGIHTIKPNPIQYVQSGIYIELKDSTWIDEDAQINVVENLFATIYDAIQSMNNDTMALYKSTIGTSDATVNVAAGTNPTNPWNHLILPCYDELDDIMNSSDYILPPIVLQSYNGLDLKRFHGLWQEYEPRILVYDPYSGYLQSRRIAEPPYILLVDTNNCHKDSFWQTYDMFEEDVVSGIGCEIDCLLGSDSNDDDDPIFLQKVRERHIVIQPWTNRPELKETSNLFMNAYEEVRHLQCELGINGLYTENIQSAITAAALGCNKHVSPMTTPTTTPPITINNTDDSNHNNVVQCPTTISNNHHHHDRELSLLILFVVISIGVAIYSTMKLMHVMPSGSQSNKNIVLHDIHSRNKNITSINKSASGTSRNNTNATNRRRTKQQQTTLVKEEHRSFNPNVHDMDHNDAASITDDEGEWIN